MAQRRESAGRELRQVDAELSQAGFIAETLARTTGDQLVVRWRIAAARGERQSGDVDLRHGLTSFRSRRRFPCRRLARRQSAGNPEGDSTVRPDPLGATVCPGCDLGEKVILKNLYRVDARYDQ